MIGVELRYFVPLYLCAFVPLHLILIEPLPETPHGTLKENGTENQKRQELRPQHSHPHALQKYSPYYDEKVPGGIQVCQPLDDLEHI